MIFKSLFQKLKSLFVDYHQQRRFVFFTLGILAILFWSFILIITVRIVGGIGSEIISGANNVTSGKHRALAENLTSADIAELEQGNPVFFRSRLGQERCIDTRKAEFLIPVSHDSVVVDKKENHLFERSRMHYSSRRISLFDPAFIGKELRMQKADYLDNFILVNMQTKERRFLFENRMKITEHLYFRTKERQMLLMQGDSIVKTSTSQGENLYLCDLHTKELQTLHLPHHYLLSYDLLDVKGNTPEKDWNDRIEESNTEYSLIRISYAPFYPNDSTDSDGNRYDAARSLTFVYDLSAKTFEPLVDESLHEWVNEMMGKR